MFASFQLLASAIMPAANSYVTSNKDVIVLQASLPSNNLVHISTILQTTTNYSVVVVQFSSTSS